MAARVAGDTFDSLAVLLSTDPADVTEVSRSAFYNERIGAAH